MNNWIDISTGKLWLGFPSWCRMWSLTKPTFPLSSPTQSGEELALPNSCCIISFRYQYLSFNIPNTFIAFLGQSHKHLTSKDAFNINVNPQIYITVKNCSSFLYFQDSVLIKSEAINVTLSLKTFVKLLTKTWIFTVVYCLRNTP